jgi:polyisoprenoid-binding protein YceI
MKKLIIFFAFVCPMLLNAQVYKTISGSASFTSDAPLELIKGQSDKLVGLINLSERTFAFSLPMASLKGFNSDLQRSHFNENYVESTKYPNATFEGKIIEEIDFNVAGKYEIRGKGKFTIHGIEQIRIIKCTLTVEADKITISSNLPLCWPITILKFQVW